MLGQRIQAAAAAAGYPSLPALAEALGWSRALIYQYVKGERLAQLDRLQEIAAVTGRPVEWFLAEEEGGSVAEVARLEGELAECRERRERLEQALAEERGQRLAQEQAHRAELREQARMLCQAQRAAGQEATVLETAARWRQLARETGDAAGATEALLQRGHAWQATGDSERAKQALEEALAEAERQGLGAVAASARQEMVRVLQALGRTGEAGEYAARVAAEERWWPRWSGRLSLAALAEQTGRLGEADRWLAAAAEAIEEGEQPERVRAAARAYLASNEANVSLARGRYAEALRRSEAHLALAGQAGLPEQLREAALNRGLALLRSGQVRAAGEALARLTEWAQMAGDDRVATLAAIFRSELDRRLGSTVEAKERALGLLERATELKSGHLLAEAELALGEAYRQEGRVEEAHHYLARVAGRAERLELQRLLVAAQLALAQVERGPHSPTELRAVAQVAELSGYEDLQAEALAAAAAGETGRREAREAVNRAVKLAEKAGAFWSVLAAYRARAGVYLSQGERDRARASLHSARELLAGAPGLAEAPGAWEPERTLARALTQAYEQAGETRAADALRSLPLPTRGEGDKEERNGEAKAG